MAKYVLVDDATTARASIFTEEFDSREEALACARRQWLRLSDYDKKRRDSFYVIESANPDEEAPDHLDGLILESFHYTEEVELDDR